MTDTLNTVLLAALEVLPMLTDENEPYCIKSTDTAEVVSGKIYDAFIYGLDDDQYNALVESARKSASRAKALAELKEWTDEVADNHEAELDPDAMGAQAELFADFPALDEAGDDDDVLTVAYALANWPDGVALPKEITAELKGNAVLKNVESTLASHFGTEKKPARSRRQRRKVEPALSSTDQTLAALADISDLVGDPDGDDAVSTDLNDDAEAQAAKAEAEKKAKEDADKKAKEEAAAKEAAKKKAQEEAEAKAKAEAEAEAKRKAEEKAQKEAEAKAKAEAEAKRKAEEKARKRSVRTTSISANTYGVVGTMRRLLLIDKEIRFDEIYLIMKELGVEAKKGTWSPKLSDLRGAYEFFESMGMFNQEQLNKFKSVEDLAKVDPAMDEEYTAKLSAAVAKHLKSKK